MDRFRNCPICEEVPEKKIYQCTEGHVICSLCITKVSGNCPHCRTPFGPIKIRNRVLEELLDGQEFECKYNDQGCAEILKRGEITNHSNSCSYKPVPLCEIIGYKRCRFTIGKSVSRSQVISHFKNDHGIPLQPRQGQLETILQVPGEALRAALTDRKRKRSNPNLIRTTRLPLLVTKDDLNTSSIILSLGQVDFMRQALSFTTIQIWGEESECFTAKFTLFKDLSTSSNEAGSSIISGRVPKLFPMRWSMNVCSIQDAHYFVKQPPVNISLPLLQDCKFGSNPFSEDGGDFLELKVSRVFNTDSACIRNWTARRSTSRPSTSSCSIYG